MRFLYRRLFDIVFWFYRNVIIFAVVFFVSSCMETRNYLLPNAVSILSGEKKLIIAAPEGFCVDQKLSSKVKGSITLFVIDCVQVQGSVGHNNLRRPISAILTATVIELENVEMKSITELKELLIQKPGINFLSRENSNALLKVHKVESDRDLLFFLIEQRRPNIEVKQSDYFWRVFFFLDGRIISMTASNFIDSTESRNKSKTLIREFANNTLFANKSLE